MGLQTNHIHSPWISVALKLGQAAQSLLWIALRIGSFPQSHRGTDKDWQRLPSRIGRFPQNPQRDWQGLTRIAFENWAVSMTKPLHHTMWSDETNSWWSHFHLCQHVNCQPFQTIVQTKVTYSGQNGDLHPTIAWVRHRLWATHDPQTCGQVRNAE